MKLLMIILLVLFATGINAAVGEGDVSVTGQVVSVTAVDETTDLVCFIAEESSETIECVLINRED